MLAAYARERGVRIIGHRWSSDGHRIRDFLARNLIPYRWLDIETDAGALKLSLGASKMALDGKPVDVGTVPEYTLLYRRFADCLKARRSDADFTPFALVADAFLLGRRVEIGPFS